MKKVLETSYYQMAHKIHPGRHRSTPVTRTDLYPTFLDLAEIDLKPKQHLDSRSLKTTIVKKLILVLIDNLCA